MRVGLIARPEDRGLGLQTWEFARHIDCSVLLVDVLEQRSDIDSHWDRFPGATRAVWRNGHFTRPRDVREWLTEVDVVYTAETFYDRNLTAWAYAHRTATVCHLNPEFWRPERLRPPTASWSATSWRLDHVAPGTEVVPYPVAAERFTPIELHDGPTRWLHVAGRRAIYDRNGTDAVLAALPMLTEPCHVTIAVQDGGDPIQLPDLPDHVDVELRGPVANYWDAYDGFDALVLPRRYGGLCLPAQEAMAAGLAVLMPGIPPNTDTWPVATCHVDGWERLHMRAGDVDVAHPDIADLALRMDDLATPSWRQAHQEWSRCWAAANSWEARAPEWLDRFAVIGSSLA